MGGARNMKNTDYFKTGKQTSALNKARLKASEQVKCQYCLDEYSLGQIKKHESSCYLNPTNIRKCPVCSTPIKGSGTTCSHACSNTYFRSGKNNGQWKEDVYRTTCFLHHDKQCVVCEESNIVAVHHFDENHQNNEPSNLIPLCPTHHQYMHSGFKHLIESQIEKYIENWRQRPGGET